MSNFKFAYKLAFAYAFRFKWLLIFSVIFGILGFFFVRLLIPFILRPSILRVGLTGRYHTDNIPLFILEEISDGLTKIDDNKNVIPSLAKAWETPDKGKTWFFYINDNINWHDETLVDVNSINYEFSDAEIEKLDSGTIIFKLHNIFSPFPSVVAKPTFKKGLLGTGSWRVNNIQLSGEFVREIEIVNNNKQKKLYKFYPTIERTKLAYKLGEIDQILAVLDPVPFDKWKTATITPKINKNQVVTLFFNTQDKFLSEKNLRQALIYAVDKDRFGERAISPISPDSWAYNPQVKKYTFDKERAKELIQDLPEQSKKDLKINLITTNALLPTAEMIANDWKEAGVEVHIQITSIIPTEFQAFLTIYDIPQDPDQYSIWHSTEVGSANISKYTSARIDKLLEDGRTSLDTETRKNLYIDFQRFLLEDVPAAFLYHPTYYTIGRR